MGTLVITRDDVDESERFRREMLRDNRREREEEKKCERSGRCGVRDQKERNSQVRIMVARVCVYCVLSLCCVRLNWEWRVTLCMVRES